MEYKCGISGGITDAVEKREEKRKETELSKTLSSLLSFFVVSFLSFTTISSVIESYCVLVSLEREEGKRDVDVKVDRGKKERPEVVKGSDRRP
jgi:hypothetical protein